MLGAVQHRRQILVRRCPPCPSHSPHPPPPPRDCRHPHIIINRTRLFSRATLSLGTPSFQIAANTLRAVGAPGWLYFDPPSLLATNPHQPRRPSPPTQQERPATPPRALCWCVAPAASGSPALPVAGWSVVRSSRGQARARTRTPRGHDGSGSCAPARAAAAAGSLRPPIADPPHTLRSSSHVRVLRMTFPRRKCARRGWSACPPARDGSDAVRSILLRVASRERRGLARARRPWRVFSAPAKPLRPALARGRRLLPSGSCLQEASCRLIRPGPALMPVSQFTRKAVSFEYGLGWAQNVCPAPGPLDEAGAAAGY